MNELAQIGTREPAIDDIVVHEARHTAIRRFTAIAPSDWRTPRSHGTMRDVSVDRPPVEILGRRLAVRRYEPSDAAHLHEAIVASVDHLRPWMPWASLEPLDLDQRESFIAQSIEGWNAGNDFNFGVFEGGALVGGCGLHRRVAPGGLEIGYWIRAERTGRGFATEAAACLVEAAFTMLDVEFVEVHHDVANVASGRIPVHLGFTPVEERSDGVAAPAEAGVERVWRLRRADWESPDAQR